MPPVLQASVQLGTITVGGCTGVKTIMAEGDIPAVKLLGELEVGIGGQACALPASRKCRALLVWLVLNPRRQRREALCDLLWSGTDDPRAGLRWSLSKVRGILGDGLQVPGVLDFQRCQDPGNGVVDHLQVLQVAGGDGSVGQSVGHTDR